MARAGACRRCIVMTAQDMQQIRSIGSPTALFCFVWHYSCWGRRLIARSLLIIKKIGVPLESHIETEKPPEPVQLAVLHYPPITLFV